MKNKLAKIVGTLGILGLGISGHSQNTSDDYRGMNYEQFLNKNLKESGKRVFRGTFDGEAVHYREDVPFVDENGESSLCNVMWVSTKNYENVFVDSKDRSKIEKNNSDELEYVVINRNKDYSKKNHSTEFVEFVDAKNKDTDRKAKFVIAGGNESYNLLKNKIYSNFQVKLTEKFAGMHLKNQGEEVFREDSKNGKFIYRENIPYQTIYGDTAYCNVMWMETKKHENILVDVVRKDGEKDFLEIMLQRNLKSNEIGSIINSELDSTEGEAKQKNEDLVYFSNLYNEAKSRNGQ